MSSNQYCKDYITITNGYSKQLACKITTSKGRTGCIFPTPGFNDCVSWLDGSATYTLNCADGTLACDQAIGCSL
jgi:hypothetical protein